MDIAIIGTGYVGLVTGTCFAEIGNNVICVDKNKNKIKDLKENKIPFYEPYLADLVDRNIKEKRLCFTHDIVSAVKKSTIVFNCVGTPVNKKDLPDLNDVYIAAKKFGQNLNGPKIFVNKSTVPAGTTYECKNIIQEEIKKNRNNHKFEIASNPEFLRQGTAVKDFMTPDRIIIGTENKQTEKLMEKLYYPIIRTGKPIINTDIKTAEFIKYVANAFIATKISFINDITAYCEKTGINIREISKAIGLDNRIGPRYLHAGIGFGGGCLKKDLQALISEGKKHGKRFKLIEQTAKTNENQRNAFFNKIVKNILIKNKKIAVWGLSYKPKTDDLRDSPSIDIIKKLLDGGANLNLFDPAAMANAKQHLPESKKIKFFKNSLNAVQNADALIILTEWDEFRSINFIKLKKLMKGNILFDGRNVIDPEEAKKAGFKYFGVGTS